MHPWTAKHTGFRSFDGTSFGELQPAEWEFDGTAEDVRDFVSQNVGEVESVNDIGAGTFDVTMTDESEVRVYTVATDDICDAKECPDPTELQVASDRIADRLEHFQRTGRYPA